MSYITEQNQPPGWYPESTGETSGDVTVRPLSVVENGTYTAPSGTAYSPVDVNVEAGLTAEALSVVANGTYTAPSGKAYTPVSVNVPIGITPSGTKQISITQNGTTTEDVTQYASAEITVNVPTGGSLPSVISKIDGGSFTVASDTALNSYTVSHNLGERPKVFIVWSDNNGESGGSYPVQTLLYGLVINSEFLYGTAHNYALFFEYFRKTNDYPNSIIIGLSEAQRNLALTDTTCAFVWRAGEFYKAGVEYKWLAWV